MRDKRTLWGFFGVLSGTAFSIAPAYTVVVVAILIGLLGLFFPLVILAALLVLAPLRSLILVHAPLRLPLDIGQMLFVLLGISILLHLAITRQRRTLCLPHTLLPLLLLVVVGGSSLFYAVSLSAALTEWAKWLAVLAIAVLVVQLSEHEQWQIVVFMLITAALANALLGLYIFFGGTGADHFLINDRFFRAFGTFEQPNPYGAFMGIILPIAITSALGAWRTNHKLKMIYYVAASAFIAAALLMSWSRGAWLAAAAACALVVCLLPRLAFTRLLLLGLVAIAPLGLTAANLVPCAITERIETSFAELFSVSDVRGAHITSENYAVIERLAHWQAALEMARYHPLGVGIGGYEHAYAKYRLMNWKDPLGHAHNIYLNMFAELGLLGLIAYAAFLAHWAYLCLRLSAHPDASVRMFSLGALGSCVYIAIHGVFDNVFVNNLFLHIGVIFAIVVYLHMRLTRNLTLE